MALDLASGPDATVLQYPRPARGQRDARKLVADALRAWRRQWLVSRGFRGRMIVVVKS